MTTATIPSRAPSLARNTVLNLVGLGAPLVVALFTIPLLTRTLGTDRLGLLTLVWVVLGYFSLFDLGLGRAITQVVSEQLSAGRLDEIPRTAWTALGLMLGLGLASTAVAAALSPWLVHSALHVPPALGAEALLAFYLLTLSIPVVMITTGLRGILEANQRFDLVNWVRVPMGVFTYLGPLLALPWSHSLPTIVAVLLVGRLVALGAHLALCVHVLPSLRHRDGFDRSLAPHLLKLGSWMSVSNLVGPILVNLDRFVLGSAISISVVAFYTVPYEAVTRLLLIPGALTGVLFPAFAASFAADRERAGGLFAQGMRATWLILFPIITILVGFAHEGLSLWLGARFAAESTRVLQWLAVGVLVNSLAQVPFALVQGAGRPDLTAKLHLVELPFYLAGMWWLIAHYGVQGAAIAWTLRALLDTLALLAMAHWCLGVPLAPLRRLALLGAAAVVVLGIAALLPSLALRAAVSAASVLAFTILGWRWLLGAGERDRLRGWIAAMLHGN